MVVGFMAVGMKIVRGVLLVIGDSDAVVAHGGCRVPLFRIDADVAETNVFSSDLLCSVSENVDRQRHYASSGEVVLFLPREVRPTKCVLDTGRRRNYKLTYFC